MKKLHLPAIGSICLMLLLSACVGQKTPQEAAQAFWESVITGDAEDAVEYSTLTDIREYDGFAQEWNGYQPSWGKVVIDGKVASIVSDFSKPGKPENENRHFVTHLVLQEKEWKVDYARTGEELRGGAFANLFGQLGQLGKKISDQFKSSSEDLSDEMTRMNEKLKELSDSVSRQASENIEKYSEELRRNLDELAESVERALKEREKQLSDEDRETLTLVAADLNESSDNLSRPSLQSIADGGKSAARAQQQLQTIDDAAIDQYKKRWQEWEEKFKEDMAKILDELSAQGDTRYRS